MFSDIQLRVVAAIASVVAAFLVQHLGQFGLDQHTADIVSTALVSGGIGWATKFATDWNKKSVPVDAIVTPAKVQLQPKPPAVG